MRCKICRGGVALDKALLQLSLVHHCLPLALHEQTDLCPVARIVFMDLSRDQTREAMGHNRKERSQCSRYPGQSRAGLGWAGRVSVLHGVDVLSWSAGPDNMTD
jgi:hypothetical protein